MPGGGSCYTGRYGVVKHFGKTFLDIDIHDSRGMFAQIQDGVLQAVLPLLFERSIRLLYYCDNPDAPFGGTVTYTDKGKSFLDDYEIAVSLPLVW